MVRTKTLTRRLPTRTNAKRKVDEAEEEEWQDPTDIDIGTPFRLCNETRGGGVSKERFNQVATKANDWRDKMIRLQEYATDLVVHNVALKKKLIDAREKLNDNANAGSSTSKTKKEDLNDELVTMVKEAAKCLVWRSTQLIFSDDHARSLTRKLLAYIQLPDDMGEDEFVEDYSSVLKQAIADARQYCQSQLGKRTKGTSYFER